MPPNIAANEQLLEAAAKHVDYEIKMLKAMTSFLSTPEGGPSQIVWRRNAYLESFVLHVRNLIDFLYPPKKPRRDDMHADAFVKEPANWHIVLPPKTPLLIDAEMRVNKLAAHLTYARIALPKNWRYADIYSDLCKALQCFYDQLTPHRQGWFPSLK
jgi:hypothetical protein